MNGLNRLSYEQEVRKQNENGSNLFIWVVSYCFISNHYHSFVMKFITTAELITEIGQEVIDLLLEKNKAYGDTANNPPQIFSKLPADEGIKSRIDDKLSRIKNKGLSDITEDTIMDLTGYLILLMVERKKNNNKIINELIKKKDERKSF